MLYLYRFAKLYQMCLMYPMKCLTVFRLRMSFPYRLMYLCFRLPLVLILHHCRRKLLFWLFRQVKLRLKLCYQQSAPESVPQKPRRYSSFAPLGSL